MARTKPAESAAFSFETVAPTAVEALPTSVRETAPNPLESHVADAVDQGPRAIPVPTGTLAKQAESFLRRAANGAGYSVKIRYTDSADVALTPATAHASETEVWVYFDVSSDRGDRAYSPRKYNNATIREWANLGENDKVTPEIRHAFRVAQGYETEAAE